MAPSKIKKAVRKFNACDGLAITGYKRAFGKSKWKGCTMWTNADRMFLRGQNRKLIYAIDKDDINYL